ncbi:glutathione S-transferase [Bradyrhizobium diazoefficiens]
MKLTFSAASPFARKVRIAAIELGLIDKIEFTPATVAPGQANEDYFAHHAAEEAAGADHQ